MSQSSQSSSTYPAPSFSKTLEFSGVFAGTTQTTPEFSIEVTYSRSNEHPPVGIIRGTSIDCHVLEDFFRSRTDRLNSLRSISKERSAIRCRDIRIRGLQEKFFPKDEQSTIHQVIGRFSIEQLEIEHEFKPSNEKASRQTTFLIGGPTKLWMTHASRTLSYTGNATTKMHNSTLSISSIPETITAQPNFIYTDRQSTSDQQVMFPPIISEAALFSLTVADVNREPTTDQPAVRTTDEFRARATQIADTLCLLISFLSKQQITWFSSTFCGDCKIIEAYRDVQPINSEAPGWEDVVINTGDIRTFTDQAFAAYEVRTAGGFDLRLPLLLYIWAQTDRFAENRFHSLFSALEKIISTLDKADPEPELLTDKELSQIGKVIRAELAKMQKADDQIKLIDAKRRELQRPPFKRRLSRHLKALEITVDDIGGDIGVRNMVRVRDRLTHEEGEVPIALVVQETQRLETIVERVLLKLLGWQGRTHTPTYSNRPIETLPGNTPATTASAP